LWQEPQLHHRDKGTWHRDADPADRKPAPSPSRRRASRPVHRGSAQPRQTRQIAPDSRSICRNGASLLGLSFQIGPCAEHLAITGQGHGTRGLGRPHETRPAQTAYQWVRGIGFGPAVIVAPAGPSRRNQSLPDQSFFAGCLSSRSEISSAGSMCRRSATAQSTAKRFAAGPGQSAGMVDPPICQLA